MALPDLPSADITTTFDNGVATIMFDRPEALNALTSEMLTALAATLDQVAINDAAEVIVLTGAGRAFCAGVDLKALGQRRLEGGKVGDVLDVPARAVTSRLSTIPKLVIAKVNGFCFTGRARTGARLRPVDRRRDRQARRHPRQVRPPTDVGHEPTSRRDRRHHSGS